MRKPQVGDWVRFRQNGHLVIGVVEYMIEARFRYEGYDLETNEGSVRDCDVLEVREVSCG